MGANSRKAARRTQYSLAIAMLMVAAQARATELTTSDRVAMLYSPQLEFSVDGDPMIKIGLLEGVSSVAFTPTEPIRVLPLGDGGPAITLPAETEYRVERLDGRPGEYRYWATVARLLPSERQRLSDVQVQWQQRGFELQRFDLGSLFAVQGTMFDNRQIVLGVGGLSDRAQADDLARRLETDYGVPADLHVELVTFPSGELRLVSEDLGVAVTHRDLLWVESVEGGRFRLEGEYFQRPGREPEDREYVGSLIFTLDRDGDLVLVNELPAERLLEGILPAEIYASAPIEALRSQAVAARGELLADLGVRYLADPYMTCATQRCQVYAGAGAEHPRTSQAIRDTRGTVLLYDNHLARTVYSASNGGSRGDFASTWGHETIPYLRHAIDAPDVPDRFESGLDEATLTAFLASDVSAFDNIDDFGGPRVYRWTVELDAVELTETVNQRYAVGAVRDLLVLERDESGRVVRLHIVGAENDIVIERELTIRRALGGLRSALFVMQVDRNEAGELTRLSLRGGGFGHGVGLSQTGAIGAAQRGLDYLSILAHYYPGTEPAQLWD